MTTNSVSYSRAGDVFHYRWAARRCLKLIYPNSSLEKIHIEGSSETEKAGEYVIDVSEYSTNLNGDRLIDYYQLKHTTVKEGEPFTLSDLKGTIEGFSKRHIQHRDASNAKIAKVTFTIITNRKIAASFKDNLSAILNGQTVDTVFLKTIKKYTKLSSQNLISFCSLLNLQDGEGNYNVQKDELRLEMAHLVAGSIDNTEVNNLVSLVQEKVMPDSDGAISREEVLKRFGVTSERDLHPAPPIWEVTENIIARKHDNLLLDKIVNSQNPLIIHGTGGVGKSVFCRQLINSLPENHLVIAYDCFGAGSYRTRSKTRHSHRVALVQIANELSSKGYCNPLIVRDTTLNEDIMRQFLSRIESSLKTLKEVDDSAKLFILIDAADNAEMAAKEYSQECFAHELLRERIPQDCKLVLLCRTGRISLLQPESYVDQLELEGFSNDETLANLRNQFPEANEKDGVEFHRLTTGNPRVQANALDLRQATIGELLASLGPFGATVQDQIASQLNFAVSKIKDQLPLEHHEQINSICTGLASLPPHIPIDVLSTGTCISIDQIKSFVLDIGRSLWLSDNTIQFRDEPTETWFRDTFLATKKNYKDYIKFLEPFASQSTYIAEILPQLYLQAGQYDKLIEIALSDNYLPENNPIDARNIRFYRLQFAFKAALRIPNFKDAIMLGMRAGEESAGNQRQLDLFINNTDLIPILQSKEKVQEIAFKRLLGSGWDGSENIYAASLLSGIKDYHGEARGYLRAALNWLEIYHQNKEKIKSNRPDNRILPNDILDLAFAHLNILGVKDCIDFLKKFKSKKTIFPIVQALTRRLIDIGDFKSIHDFLRASESEVYYIVATISELNTVGSFPDKSILDSCLNLLCDNRKRISIPRALYQDPIVPGIISFIETCLFHGLESKKILKVIKYYTPKKASRMVWDFHFSDSRTIFLRALAIKNLLEEKQVVKIEEISPTEFKGKKKSYEQNNELDKLRTVISTLFPWYMLRAQILYGKTINLFDAIENTKAESKETMTHRYNIPNTIRQELTQVYASIIIFYSQGSKEEVDQFFEKFLNKDNNYGIQNKLYTLRAAHRLPHLKSLREQLEIDSYEFIKGSNDEGPDELSDKYIALSRAVLVTSIEDASVYFDEAIKIVSKFGDEIVERWEAVVSLAEKSCGFSGTSDILAYRFIRCAELVGENVDREKHWDRSKATQICIRMSTGVGISSLSRWRDRDIGRHKYQFEAALLELVKSKFVSSSIAWSLTSFYDLSSINLLSLCLENESYQEVQHKILQDAVSLSQLKGESFGFWHQLKRVAIQHNLQNPTLNSIVESYPIDEEEDEKFDINFDSEETREDWGNIFEGIDLVSIQGITKLINRFKIGRQEYDIKHRMSHLLIEAVGLIDSKNIWDFIEILFLFDDFSRYDIENLISSLPISIKKKVSFKLNFERIIHNFGKKFAHELLGNSLNYHIKNLNLDESSSEKLKAGIRTGLANGHEFAQSDVFFGFVRFASSVIESKDAIDLLDFALKRFELHIDREFGDKEWSARLNVSDNIDINIAGYIWSALGSPRSGVRWNAAHCIRKLVEFNCTNVLDSLVNWFKLGKVRAFGSFKFPFYDLHAKQYLLMAFQSVSSKNPDALTKYHDLFLDIALSVKHILIQQFAASIILNIENKFSGTYSKSQLDSVKKIGLSPFPIEEKEYDYLTDSYWHQSKEIKLDTNLNFGSDISSYWFGPLGDVFGLPNRQIEDLAAEVIINDLKTPIKRGYSNDPRVNIWNDQEMETYFHKSSYPSTDNLDFYQEYHAMLVVAAKLLEKMPIIKRIDSEEDPWSDWISNHNLINEDGQWLADLRSPVPLYRPSWTTAIKQEAWQNGIKYEDFLYYLFGQKKEKTWITVKGSSLEKLEEKKEVFSISTALVSKTTSEALLRALATCSDYMDYKLPDFNEVRSEIDSGIFQLKGWLANVSTSNGIEELDPNAFGVTSSYFLIDETILNQFNLTKIEGDQVWIDKDSSKKVVMSRTWSSSWKGKDEEVDQSGAILTAELSFLKNLCETLDYDLIFDVSLKRDIIYNRYSQEKRDYAKPQHKIFILSSDGKLRSTDENYQLG